ncbi:hypothetical protein [Sphingomonas sp. G-3-2-10]|uniref:hypothetical protein n=1 Tax=Sphingomonas sp. G-3-2-10 TaxID=2728838 RepID=UPI00146E9747|nr:hypothetical protein [Sphingomonas sp. G-3-2-10]NML04273.1 hypothetical protein [Sphingomonas sp. G-3-2-10]
MNLLEEFGPLAVELLAEFGAPATLSATGPAIASFDKRTGRATLVTTPAAQTVQAVVTPVDVTDEQGRQTTKTVATMTAKPTQGDKLTLGEFTYTVGSVTVHAPQGQAIYYLAEVS